MRKLKDINATKNTGTVALCFKHKSRMNKAKHNHVCLELFWNNNFKKQIGLSSIRQFKGTECYKNTGRVDLKLKSKQKYKLK